MKQLHLVGFTTDHKGLIFGARRGNQEGSYVVMLDQELVEQIEDLLRLQASEGVAGIAPLASGNGSAGLLRRPKAQSRLTPREVQALLRTGRSVTEIAETAGMSEDWVGRFAPPVLAEQARVVAQAVVLTYSKPRIGPSTQPLGESVSWNLADRGVVLSGEALEDAWSAFQQPDGGWVVRVSYLSERRRQHADWTIDMTQGVLKAVNRLGNELGYVEPGRRRPPSLPPVTASASAQRAAATPPKLTPPPPLPARPSGRVSLLSSGTPGRQLPPQRSMAPDRRSSPPADRGRTETDLAASAVASPPPSSASAAPFASAPPEPPTETAAAPSRPAWRAQLESPHVPSTPRQRRARPLRPPSTDRALDTAPASNGRDGATNAMDATPTEATPTEATPTEATPTEATPREATPRGSALTPETPAPARAVAPQSEPEAAEPAAAATRASATRAVAAQARAKRLAAADARAARAAAAEARAARAAAAQARATRMAAAQARAARSADAPAAAYVPAETLPFAEPASPRADVAPAPDPSAPAPRRERPLRAPSRIRRDEVAPIAPERRRPLVSPAAGAPNVVPIESDRAADQTVRPAASVRRSTIRSSADTRVSTAERFGVSRDRAVGPSSGQPQNGASDPGGVAESESEARSPFERRVRPSRPLRSRAAASGAERFSPEDDEPAPESLSDNEGEEHGQVDTAFEADGPITAPVPAIAVFGAVDLLDSVDEVNGDGGPGRDQVLIRAGQAGAPEPAAEPAAGKDKSAPSERHGRTGRLRLRRRPQASK